MCGLLLVAAIASFSPGQALAQVPSLESNPGAGHVLLLDFQDFYQPERFVDCAPDSAYPNVRIGLNPEQTAHGVVHRMLDAERFVSEIWEAVSEDYAPFDVNVTTDLSHASAQGHDASRQVRVVLGEVPGVSALGYAPATGCSGLPAYQDPASDNVAFVRIAASGNPSARIIARRVSHEAGHVYGLQHQPHGPDYHSYAIMGYSERPRHVWVRGIDESGQWQDDIGELIAMIGVRGDDHGRTSPTATTMIPVENAPALRSPRVFEYGVIETVQDEDMLTFRVTEEGPVTVSAYMGTHADVEVLNPLYGVESNLRLELELRDESGSQSILRPQGTSFWLDALAPRSITLPPPPGQVSPPPTLATGKTYRLVVRSRGRYEDVGQYTIVVDGPVSDLSGPRVVGLDRACKTGTSERIRVHFDQAVDYRPSSLIAAQPFARLSGAGGPVPLQSVAPYPANDPTPTSFDLTFPATGAPHELRIEIGVQPIAGFGRDPMGQPYWMDQDDDGKNGEWNDDYLRKPGRGLELAPQPCDLPELERSAVIDETFKSNLWR